jgi:hypothetical protein
MRGITEQKSEKFSVREFVVLDNTKPEYPDYIKFQLSNANCDLIDSFKQNDIIEVEFNLQGRKWEKDGKVSYFNTLSAWKVRLVSSATTIQSQTVNASTPVGDATNDLPF